MKIFKNNARYGIKKGNKVIIKPEFSYAREIKTGNFLLAIRFKEKESTLFFFDGDLKFLQHASYISVCPNECGFLVCSCSNEFINDKKMGFYDGFGKLILPCIFSNIELMDNFLLALNNEGSFLFDLSGKKVQKLLINGVQINPNSKEFELSNYHGLLQVKDQNSQVSHYSLELGKQVLQYFSDIYCIVTLSSGNNVIKANYAGKFGDKWGISDLYNSYILPYQPAVRCGDFIIFGDFKKYGKTEYCGICDLNGNVILESKLQKITYIGCDMFYIEESNAMGGVWDDYYVDSNGKNIRASWFYKVLQKLADNKFIVLSSGKKVIVNVLDWDHSELCICDDE